MSCTCDKNKVDGYCGCNHFENLLGYKVEIGKKEKTDPSSEGDSSKTKKKVDLKDIGAKATDTYGNIKNLLSGLKKGNQEPEAIDTSSVDTSQKSKMPMIIGISIAIIVIVVIFILANKKK